MKKVIVGLVGKPPFRKTAHGGGNALKWEELTNADVFRKPYTCRDLIGYDEVILFNGMNDSPGKLNCQSGCTYEDVQPKIDAVVEAKEKGAVILQTEYPQRYAEVLAKRKVGLVVPDWFDEIPVVLQTDLQPQYVSIGDSHALSVAPKGWSVNRNDGLMLFAALRAGLDSFMTGLEKEVIFKLMEIDLRHHLCRRVNPEESMMDMLRKYLNQLSAIAKTGVDVSAVVPMAQTLDSRKIPNTGKYKGNNYAGSFEKRTALALQAGAVMREFFPKLGVKVIEYPSYYTMVGGSLSTVFMEGGAKGGSVHLAPTGYLREVSYA